MTEINIKFKSVLEELLIIVDKWYLNKNVCSFCDMLSESITICEGCNINICSNCEYESEDTKIHLIYSYQQREYLSFCNKCFKNDIHTKNICFDCGIRNAEYSFDCPNEGGNYNYCLDCYNKTNRCPCDCGAKVEVY